MAHELLLEGKAIVITGAGRGLGAAYARLAAAHGAKVVVNDLNIDAAGEVANEIDGVADGSDISNWDEAASLIERCVNTFGVIDGLVNNAGIVSVDEPQEVSELTLRRVISVNLLGTAFCGTNALRYMRLRGSGAIVNVASGAYLGLASMAAYSASKGGVVSLTYSWAADLEGSGVRVNAVAPDARTPLADSLSEKFPNLPTGRWEASTNAPAVIYLLSEAAQQLNGQVFMTGGERLARVEKPAVMSHAIRGVTWDVDTVAEAMNALYSG